MFGMDDQKFMREALLEAKKAFSIGEVPVGCVIVFENTIIARAHNQTENLIDPTSHAELLAIRDAAKFFNDWRLTGTTLYTTLEPCTMCAGAAVLGRVERIVWGAPDHRQGALVSHINVFEKKHPIHEIKIDGPVLEEESAYLLKSFFQEVRWKKSLMKSSLIKNSDCSI